MPNISVSLSERNLDDLDRIGGELGLLGRSETIRSAIRSLSDEIRDRKDLSGKVEGVLIVVRGSEGHGAFEAERHLSLDLIKAQVHIHTSDGRCAEIIFLSGDSGPVRELLGRLRGSSMLGSVRFLSL